jgi:hypothetical protein
MVSILQIDSLGKRYGLLPSEVLERGNTFDLYIMDAALTFEQYHHKKSMNNGKVPTDAYSTEQLMAINDRSTNKKNAKVQHKNR